MSVVQVERCSIDVQLAAVRLELGRLDEAEQLARASLDAIRTDSVDRVCGYVVLSRVAAMRGSPDDGALLLAAEDQARGFGDLERAWPIAAARAEAAWLAGSLDEAVPGLERAYELATEANAPWAIGDLGRWLWRAGRLDALDPRAAAPYALQVAGDWRAAEAEWVSLEIPFEAALCRADSDDPADLRDAHARLERLGAHGAARRVAARLRELGEAVPRGPRATTRAHAAGLTAREAEIAGLAAKGMTNREIADHLVLAEKTVGHHVSAALAKLGVRRRGEIGAAIQRS
jgi:DNA-binding CsgD family transcriptional regulator